MESQDKCVDVENEAPPMALSLLSSVFTTREPKHVGQGIADAARNVLAGVGMGVSSLVALPIAGGKEEGAVGVAKGLCVGLLGFAGVAATGVVMGARQLGRGVLNTKVALEETVRGDRYWCGVRGQWIEVRLDEMLADFPATDDDIYSRAREAYRKISVLSPTSSSTTTPSDGGSEQARDGKDYYSLMGVEKTATASEIRASFHRRALELHPDKNSGDAAATQRFQDLLEAYNVLSNEMRRAEYDAGGSVSCHPPEGGLSSSLEEALGAAQLDPFVGRIGWAIHFTSNVYFTSELKQELKWRRILRLAQQLLRVLDGDDGALEALRPYIVDAASTRGGARLMPVVAAQYAAAARQHLAGSAVRREMDSFGTSKLAFISGVKDTAVACVKTAVSAARKGLDGNEFVDAVLTLCETDVQKNVLRAARLVLYDLSASVEQRNERARRLLKMSETIKDICSSIGTVEA